MPPIKYMIIFAVSAVGLVFGILFGGDAGI